MDMFCNKCTLQFDKKYVFDLHLSLVHGEKIEIKNESLECEEMFKEPETSEKVFSDCVVDTIFKCNICNLLLKTKRNLKRHIESVHEGKKPFKCNTCDVNFAAKDSLKRHISLVHERKKSFNCNICDCNFATQQNLNGHIATRHE